MLKISRRWFGDLDFVEETQYLTMRPLTGDTSQWGRGQSLVCVSDETYGDVSVPLNGTLEISYIDPALAMSQMNAAAEAGGMEAGR